MKIKLNESESYNFDIPDEIDPARGIQLAKRILIVCKMVDEPYLLPQRTEERKEKLIKRHSMPKNFKSRKTVSREDAIKIIDMFTTSQIKGIERVRSINKILLPLEVTPFEENMHGVKLLAVWMWSLKQKHGYDNKEDTQIPPTQ